MDVSTTAIKSPHVNKISRNKNPETKHLSLKEYIFLGVNLERVAENVGAAILLIC